MDAIALELRWSGLTEEQQAVVKRRALGDMSHETISKSMRSVYPDFVVKGRAGVALVEDNVSDDEHHDDAGVQGFDDIELFLADYVT